MKWQSPDQLLKLLKELVGIKSISATEFEINAANYIYDQLKTLPYYQENPDHLIKVDVKGNVPRICVIAMYLKGPSKKTLLGIGHFDTVGVDEAGSLKDLMFNPDEYTKKISSLPLNEDSKKDLESNKYIFGRGVMDMKMGDVLLMSSLEYYMNKDDFDGNLIFSFVGDEEVNSDGVLTAIPKVNELLKQYGLQAIAALDTEPNFASYPGDDNKYLYIGTVGKLLAGFFVVGKETHVGESLQGMNVHLVLANIIKRMELNMDFAEIVDGEVTLPPTSLKMEDHKRLYNVQTPLTGHIYYNIPTFKNTPKVIMDKMEVIAQDAIKESYDFVKKQNEIFREKSKTTMKEFDFDPQVITYSELYEDTKKEFNNLDELLVNKIKELQPEKLDERDLTIRLIQYLQELSSNKHPKIILFFAPPYYPHVSLNEDNSQHQAIIKAADDTIKYAKDKFNVDVKKVRYFQGLCDLSYFALEDAEDVLNYLKPNMPTLNKTYSLPLEDIANITVPVINYGPHGKDPHKYTERLEVDYSTKVVPDVLKHLIDDIFKG
ncbi:MAG: M20/M25/M40 family metallo-hydrolase [Bacilli bacterium]|jgi:arginine utilization protein RocB|nr:M20/M25/M40 family metallo-hydrolase [Bacilli bacterium]